MTLLGHSIDGPSPVPSLWAGNGARVDLKNHFLSSMFLSSEQQLVPVRVKKQTILIASYSVSPKCPHVGRESRPNT